MQLKPRAFIKGELPEDSCAGLVERGGQCVHGRLINQYNQVQVFQEGPQGRQQGRTFSRFIGSVATLVGRKSAKAPLFRSADIVCFGRKLMDKDRIVNRLATVPVTQEPIFQAVLQDGSVPLIQSARTRVIQCTPRRRAYALISLHKGSKVAPPRLATGSG
jgi:hypothetical protein